MMPGNECEGWWEQDFLSRQPMENLWLEFDGGVVTGAGIDMVGPFTLNGWLDQGKITLVKQYENLHRVDYIGDYDGEGTLQGTWHIADQRGRWAIHIVADRKAARSSDMEQITPD